MSCFNLTRVIFTQTSDWVLGSCMLPCTCITEWGLITKHENTLTYFLINHKIEYLNPFVETVFVKSEVSLKILKIFRLCYSLSLSCALFLSDDE